MKKKKTLEVKQKQKNGNVGLHDTSKSVTQKLKQAAISVPQFQPQWLYIRNHLSVATHRQIQPPNTQFGWVKGCCNPSFGLSWLYGSGTGAKWAVTHTHSHMHTHQQQQKQQLASLCMAEFIATFGGTFDFAMYHFWLLFLLLLLYKQIMLLAWIYGAKLKPQ